MSERDGQIQLSAFPGFDWSAVSWWRPDEKLPPHCSLCDVPFGDGEVPLLIFSPSETAQPFARDSWRAVFCEDCASTWWGIERLA